MPTDKTAYIKSNKPLYISNLVARMVNNERFGEHDFEAWVFKHLSYPAGAELMDIACGSGKAMFKLIEAQPQIGRLVGIDFAETAIDMLTTRAHETGVSDRVEGIVIDMEHAPRELSARRFDHLFSIYGIHYSPRMAELLCEYKALLKPGGTIFVCGPDAFSNTSVMRILSASAVLDVDPIAPRMLKPFISEAQLEVLRGAFARVDLNYFENPIHFPDVESFLTWWRNHDLYREPLEAMMRQRVSREIAARGRFTVNKNSLGVTLQG